jgi:hypothetical protein
LRRGCTENLGRSGSVNRYPSPGIPVYRVDSKYGFGRGMNNVVSDYTGLIMDNYCPMKVMEDEESIEKNPGTPEGIRNPDVHVIIRPGRLVISDHRRSVVIVIIVDDLRIGVRRVIIGGIVISSIVIGGLHSC